MERQLERQVRKTSKKNERGVIILYIQNQENKQNTSTMPTPATNRIGYVARGWGRRVYTIKEK